MKKICLLVTLTVLSIVGEDYAANANHTDGVCAQERTGKTQSWTCSEVKPEPKPEEKVRKVSPKEIKAVANAAKWTKEGEKYLADCFKLPQAPSMMPPQIAERHFLRALRGQMQKPLQTAQLLALTGRTAEAKSLFQKIDQHWKQNKPVGLNNRHEEESFAEDMLKAVAAAGLHEMALDIFKQAKEQGKRNFFDIIVTAEAHAGFYDNAVEVVQNTDAKYVRVSERDRAYRNIISIAISAGDLKEAKRMTDSLLKDDRLISAMLLQIATQEAKSGDKEAAKKTFRQAFAIAKSNGSDYTSILRGAIKAGLPDEARAALTRITVPDDINFAWLLTLTEIRIALGDKAEAALMIKKAKKVFSEKPCLVTTSTVNEMCRIAAIEARAIGKDAALATFKQADEYAAYNRCTQQVESDIITYMAKAGLYDEAKERVGKLSGKEKDDTLKRIAMTECEDGLYEQAKKTAELIKDDYDRNKIYWAIITTHAYAGRFDEARGMLDLLWKFNRRNYEICLVNMEIEAGETKYVEDTVKRLLAGKRIAEVSKLLARAGRDDRLKELYASKTDKNILMDICISAARGYMQRARDIRHAAEYGKAKTEEKPAGKEPNPSEAD